MKRDLLTDTSAILAASAACSAVFGSFSRLSYPFSVYPENRMSQHNSTPLNTTVSSSSITSRNSSQPAAPAGYSVRSEDRTGRGVRSRAYLLVDDISFVSIFSRPQQFTLRRAFHHDAYFSDSPRTLFGAGAVFGEARRAHA